TSSSYCMQAFGDALGPDAVGLFASDKPDAADVNASALTPEGRRMLEWASERYKARWHEPMGAAALSGFSNAYALFVHVLPAAGAGAAMALVLVTAPPASAHTITGVAPTDYRSEILGVNPKWAGVSVHLLDLGNRVELVNTGPVDVVVLGYQGEPYLRVGAAG